MTNFLTLITYTLAGWATFILAKMSLLTTPYSIGLAFPSLLAAYGALNQRLRQLFSLPRVPLFKIQNLVLLPSIELLSEEWDAPLSAILFLSSDDRHLSITLSLMSASRFAKLQFCACFLTLAMNWLTVSLYCWAMLLNTYVHSLIQSLIQSLIRFIKLGDKIRVQSTYRFLEINSRILLKFFRRAWVS